MALTGAWLSAKRAPDPQQALTHQVNADHFEPGNVDQYAQTLAYTAPPYQEVAASSPYVGMEWVTNAPGLNAVEAAGHDEDTGHDVDNGGISGHNLEPAVQFQFSDEAYTSNEWQGFEGQASALDPIVHTRGKNAEDVNNPPDESYGGEGFRRGRYMFWEVKRNFRPPTRHHDARYVGVNTVTPIGDAPPPDNSGPRNSPFSSLARARRVAFNRPMMRRIPPSFDEAMITDGSEEQETTWAQPRNPISQWVAG